MSPNSSAWLPGRRVAALLLSTSDKQSLWPWHATSWGQSLFSAQGFLGLFLAAPGSLLTG